MKISKPINKSQSGYTIVEILIACIIFPVIVTGISNSFQVLQNLYDRAREYNNLYMVLSACPELDRALEFTALNNNANCYPNNELLNEGENANTKVYSPIMNVSDTASLPSNDALKLFPDSKTINISLAPPGNTSPIELRMLITRNGIAQQ